MDFAYYSKNQKVLVLKSRFRYPQEEEEDKKALRRDFILGLLIAGKKLNTEEMCKEVRVTEFGMIKDVMEELC